MNNTLLYTAGQQAALPLAGLVVCPLVSFGVFKLARMRLRKVESDSLRSRAYLFYLIISGILLGQCIGHLDLNSLFSKLFFAVGYFLFNAADTVGRIWNTNSNFIALPESDCMDDVGLNKDTMEEQTVVVAMDITSTQYQQTAYLMEVVYKDNRKRQWFLGCLIVSFGILSFSSGLSLVYHAPTPAVFICYYLNAIALSVSVHGAMIHAKFHVTEGIKPRVVWWTVVSGVWCLLYFFSSLFVLCGMDPVTATQITQHYAWVTFYAMAAGAILRMQQYYHNMKVDATEKQDHLVGILVFGVALGQSLVTSYFL